MVFGIVWLVAFTLMAGALLMPPHKLSGYPASLIALALTVCGLALSLRAV